MDWTPLPLADLHRSIDFDLPTVSPELRAFYERVAFPPEKWSLSPWGDLRGGFWAVAAVGGVVLWYNGIEEGFNLSAYTQHGEIPDDPYWCNQSRFREALLSLFSVEYWGDAPAQAGPPQNLRTPPSA